MPEKEATARIRINRLLEAARWRFFPDGTAPANIRLEPGVTIRSVDLDALGENFEKAEKGFVDFLLLDARGFPLVVLEAKAENKNPLVGKEQARRYARSQNCRFIILSNGNLHYFWDLERGNPYVITSFPTPDSIVGYQKVAPNPKRVLFLADRLELEDQAKKALAAPLSAEFQTGGLQENRDDWRRAEIVVTTVRAVPFNNKYQRTVPTKYRALVPEYVKDCVSVNQFAA